MVSLFLIQLILGALINFFLDPHSPSLNQSISLTSLITGFASMIILYDPNY